MELVNVKESLWYDQSDLSRSLSFLLPSTDRSLSLSRALPLFLIENQCPGNGVYYNVFSLSQIMTLSFTTFTIFCLLVYLIHDNTMILYYLHCYEYYLLINTDVFNYLFFTILLLCIVDIELRCLTFHS